MVYPVKPTCLSGGTKGAEGCQPGALCLAEVPEMDRTYVLYQNTQRVSNEVHRDRTIGYRCKYPVVWCEKSRRKVLVARLQGLILEKQEQ
jgi:hypothetical protein